MVLTIPNPISNTTLSSAQAFINAAAQDGFSGATLAINTFQTMPGEIVNILPQSKWASTPGMPTGNFRAGFVVQFSGATPDDPNAWINIGETLFYMSVYGWTVLQALSILAGLTPGAK